MAPRDDTTGNTPAPQRHTADAVIQQPLPPPPPQPAPIQGPIDRMTRLLDVVDHFRVFAVTPAEHRHLDWLFDEVVGHYMDN